MKVIVKLYDGSKYEKESKVIETIEYEIEGYTVYSGKDAEDLETMMHSDDDIDENHEYLVLDLGDLAHATFRNSHVDMFKY